MERVYRRGIADISRTGRSSFSGSQTRRRPGRSRPHSRDDQRGGGRRHSKRSSSPARPSFDPSQFINVNPVALAPEAYTPKHTFGTFGLNDQLVRATHTLGMTTPTPIQDQVIPEILAGRDVVGLAETGTGKTAAFLLPLIEKTVKDPKRQTLILAPTRELALQIAEEFRKLTTGGVKLYSAVCVGGVGIHPQIRALKYKNHFVIGTPGRILDLINRNVFDPSKVTTVILDEADRMLDMGFIGDMRAILAKTPKERETLFFSATMTGDAKSLINEFMHDPATISVKKRDVTNSIEQNIVPFEYHAKFEKLTELLSQPEFQRVIIFGAMKHSVEKLAQQLTRSRIYAESLHGNKSHVQRQRALKNFKTGRSRVLVATDVAARGIHVDDVTHVINYDLPGTFEDYVHRIGRTGRGTKRGKALTFVPKGETIRR